MAVPFNMPEDQNEVEVLLMQLQTLLNRLQVAVRRNQQLSQQQPSATASSSSPQTSTTGRVRNPPNPSRVRSRTVSQSTQSTAPIAVTHNVLPDLLTNLTLLAANGTSTSPLTAITVRSPRRRTNSESSNTDETKISITAIVKHDFYASHDWNKIDCVDATSSNASTEDGLFSKLIPGAVSSCSLMTAMICFVGWHIFRAR